MEDNTCQMSTYGRITNARSFQCVFHHISGSGIFYNLWVDDETRRAKDIILYSRKYYTYLDALLA